MYIKMEEIIKKYEALTIEQKEMCKEGFEWAYKRVLHILAQDEESIREIKECTESMELLLIEMTSLNIEPELIKKRTLVLEQFKELAQLEIELRWILPILSIMN
jgi:hypothetical protein